MGNKPSVNEQINADIKENVESIDDLYGTRIIKIINGSAGVITGVMTSFHRTVNCTWEEYNGNPLYLQIKRCRFRNNDQTFNYEQTLLLWR